MIDTGAFKTAIIDLAVTGQLSAQFHADDSVDEITTALPPLSNKRKKLLGQSFEYGKKATLPDHWRWICLGEISSYGDTPKKAHFDEVSGDTWILDLEDIRSGGQIIKKTRVHGKKFIGDKTVFREGQVLYSKLRPYLKKVLVADEDGISTPELISFDTYGGVIPQYVVYCLLSSFTDRAIEKRSYGIKMPRIDAAFMVNLPIPVPPVSEQQFIVDRVQEAFFQIDNIDKLQAQYANNLTTLKIKLIDAAIQGKLTEQLPADGTAEELYGQIQADKQQLLKEGKIKKEKPLALISDDEIPFEIPNSWKWARIGNVINEVIVPQRDKPPFSGDIPWCRIEDKDGYLLNGTKSNQFVSKETVDKMNLRVFPIGTVLSACSGASIGTILINTVECCTNQTFNGLVCSNGLYNWYLFWYLKSAISKLQNMGTGSAMAYVSQDKIRSLVIPLPPLSEQKRIVETLNKALIVIDS